MRISPAGNEDGYTLTELMVVLAILALVVSVVPTAYRAAVPSARLKHALVELATYLRQERAWAMRTAQPVSLSVTGDTISKSADDSAGFDAPGDVSVSYEPAFDKDGGGLLLFYPDGGSSGGLVWLHQDGRRRAIELNWLTGQVSIMP